MTVKCFASSSTSYDFFLINCTSVLIAIILVPIKMVTTLWTSSLRDNVSGQRYMGTVYGRGLGDIILELSALPFSKLQRVNTTTAFAMCYILRFPNGNTHGAYKRILLISAALYISPSPHLPEREN